MAAVLLLSAAAPTAANASTYKIGDVNKSGSVTIADARLVLRYVVKLDTFTAEQKKLADADLNGAVNEADARFILRYTVGLEKLHSHSYGAWQQKSSAGNLTAYHYKYCSCGEMMQAAHTYETVVIREGTCTQTGVAYSRCTGCGYSTTPVTTSVQHDFEIISRIEPTCTENGKIENKCRSCGTTKNDILPMGHVPGAAATCTLPRKCTRCNEVLTEALGHIYPDTVEIKLTSGIKCTRCDKIIIHSFNALVNELKNGSYKFTQIDKDVSTFKEPKYTGIMKLLKNEFDKEFKSQIGTTTEYSPMITNRLLTVNNFYLYDTDVVSELQTGDIQSIKTEKISGLDFTAAIPDSFKDTSGRTYDATAYKNRNTGNVYKVTVTLKSEKYSECKDKGGSVHIDKVVSGYGDLMKYTFDGLSGVDMEGIMKAEGDAVSNATVVYYFDASTFEPVAATYKVSMNLNESMNIYLMDTDDGDTIISKDPTGSVKMEITNNMYSYFFFDKIA